MLARLLLSICTPLNEYICTQIQQHNQWVHIQTLTNEHGKITPQELGLPQLFCQIIQFAKSPINYENNIHYREVYLAFIAHSPPKAYLEALELLDYCSTFFQKHKQLGSHTFPLLPTSIHTLEVEAFYPDSRMLTGIWGRLNYKQLPALFYKIRSVPVLTENNFLTTPLINNYENDISTPS